MLSRRRFLHGTLVVVLANRVGMQAAQAQQLIAVRVWPAPDYSRVTLESSEPLSVKQTLLRNPDRLVVDIAGLELDSALRDLVAKVKPDDPYIAAVRLGQPELKLVRIVFDLRTRVTPQSYVLAPVARYQYRQVFDLYPEVAPDPIAALLESRIAEDSPAMSADPLGDLIALRGDRVEQAERALGLPSSAAPSPGTAGQLGKPASRTPVVTASQPRSNDALRQPASKPAVPAAVPQSSPDTVSTARAGRASSSPAPAVIRSRTVTVTLDPGHGGEDPGAIGPAGTYEKHVVLSIADQLRDLLLSTTGMRVLMTRDSDFFVPLGQRVRKARGVKSDLFLSIHADAFVNTAAKGASVFALSERGASSTLARLMAKRENSSDEIGGVNYGKHEASVVNVLLDLSTSGQIQQSRLLGGHVLQQLARIGNLHSPRVEQAGFAVLKAPDIPSVLIETAFISNPQEEQRLRDKDYQREIALAIYGGLRRHLRV